MEAMRRIPSGWSIRLTPSEREAFHAVARAREMTLSELFRCLMAEAAEEEGIRIPSTREVATT